MRAITFIPLALCLTVALSALSPERSFWKLFKKHQRALYEESTASAQTLTRLREALAKVHPELLMELGPKPESGPRVLTISAGGSLPALPWVFFLVDGAPKLKGWHIQKFRPRQPIRGSWEIEGQAIELEKIHYLLYSEENPKKVGIMLFFPGYRLKERERFEKTARQILYRALGELDATIKIGTVIARDPGSHFFGQSHPLPLLPKNFDMYFQYRQ